MQPPSDINSLQNQADKLLALAEVGTTAVHQLMQPLLTGEMTLDQHAEWLKQQLSEVSADD